CCSERIACILHTAHLVAPIFLQSPPTRFILEPLVVGTEKPLFLLRALPQKKSDFAVLVSDGVNLELVEWCLPGIRATRAVQASPVEQLLPTMYHSARFLYSLTAIGVSMARKNAFYAQSGGVTSVINASAAGVIEAARNSNIIEKVYSGRNGIIGSLSEDLIYNLLVSSERTVGTHCT